MKNLIYITTICMLGNFAIAQQPNLVPNGSFETYINCPTTLGQVTSHCATWYQFTGGSSDYFNACGSGAAAVPVGYWGYQQPADGNAYVGLITLISGSATYKEYVAAPMTPMQVGATYEVSMSVSLGNICHYATDDLGVYFFDNGPTTMSGTGIVTTSPQVSYSSYGPITDTQNWVRVTKIFTADSTYDNIVIGGFKDNSNITVTTMSGTSVYANYLIDSVVVKLAKRFGINFKDTALCAGQTIRVPYYANTLPLFFQTNNVFTLQLSNASGSFANPVNIGTKSSYSSDTITGVIPVSTPVGGGYRLRMISSNGADTTFDNGINIGIGTTVPAKPVANNNGPICNNDTLKLTASSTTSGVSYRWTGPNSFTSAVQNPKINNPLPVNGGSYIVTAYIYGCTSKDTTTAVVYAGSGPTGTTATTNAPICADDTLKLFGTANGSSNTYSWTGPNSFTSNIQNPKLPAATAAMSGAYVLYASNGNCTSRDTVTVLVKPRPADFTAGSNSPICTGEALNFTASSSSTGVTYAWAGPNSFTSSIANPAIGSASSVHNGDYTVTATLNGCSLKDTVTALVKPLPAKPVANSNSAICAGSTLNLSSNSTTPGVTYSWTGPNSYTSNVQNPAVTNTTTAMSGSYIVSATLNSCTTKDTTTVLVKPLPAPVSASSNSPVCAGDTLKINIGTSSTGVTYNWTGPNSFTAATQNTFVANSPIAASGWYKGTLNLNGCQYKDSTLAVVNAIPATPAAGYSSPLCVGETLQLSATNVAGAAYLWTGVNGFTANTQNPTRSNMQFGDTGVYHVTATINGCTSPEGHVRVTINPVPFVVIFPTPGDSICVGELASFTALPNNHGGTPQYQWFVNGLPKGTNSTAFSGSSFNNGDIVRCDMTENTKCNAAYTDASNDVELKVLPWLAPAVSITANPNKPLDVNEYVTFTATVTNGGLFPKFQWKRNGQNVQGATGAVWSAYP